MPTVPLQPTDQFDAMNRVVGQQGSLVGEIVGGIDRFTGANATPRVNGLGTRQGQISPLRLATPRRKIMRWLVPEQPLIEMYLNPQQVQYNYKKQINRVRTKGGYLLQYWGEELTTLQINGTTGTSGIEGINVLYDIYRNEQLMFDPYALFLQAERDRAEEEESSAFSDIIGIAGGDVFGSTISSILTGAADSGVPNTSRTKPTLASLAFTVELYWSGEVYRGFFDNFTVTESAEKIGLFDYNFTFTVTQKRGFRQNFFGWHKSATHGASESGPSGPPRSFSQLGIEQITPQAGSGKSTIGVTLEAIGDLF